MARKSKSLERLLSQINSLAPNRKKASDGWLGDQAHQKVVSDHNPNPLGVVLALDVTHDPKHGADMQKIADAIFDSKDNRIWYIIFNKRIRYMGGKWQPYYGSNPHTKHAHFNNVHTRSRYDNGQAWNIKGKENMYKGKTAEQHYKEKLKWAERAEKHFKAYKEELKKVATLRRALENVTVKGKTALQHYEESKSWKSKTLSLRTLVDKIKNLLGGK